MTHNPTQDRNYYRQLTDEELMELTKSVRSSELAIVLAERLRAEKRRHRREQDLQRSRLQGDSTVPLLSRHDFGAKHGPNALQALVGNRGISQHARRVEHALHGAAWRGAHDVCEVLQEPGVCLADRDSRQHAAADSAAIGGEA